MLCDCSILSIHHSSNANVFVWQWISLSCGFRPFNRTMQCFYVMWRMTGSVRTVNIGAREMSKIVENHGWQPSAPSRIHRGRGLCLYSASALQRSECWISGSDGVGKCQRTRFALMVQIKIISSAPAIVRNWARTRSRERSLQHFLFQDMFRELREITKNGTRMIETKREIWFWTFKSSRITFHEEQS